MAVNHYSSGVVCEEVKNRNHHRDGRHREIGVHRRQNRSGNQDDRNHQSEVEKGRSVWWWRGGGFYYF